MAVRTASALSAGTKITHLSSRLGSAAGASTPVDGQAERGGQRVGHPWRGRVGVGVRGEQGTAAPNQPVQQRALRSVRRHRVDAAQQQRVVCKQQPALGHLGDHLGGRVDGDRHRLDRLGRVAADQADGVPVVGEPGWVRAVEHAR